MTAILPSLQCPNAELHDGMQGIGTIAVDDAHAQLMVTFLRPIDLPAQGYLLNAGSYSLTGGQKLFPRVIKAELSAATSPPGPATPQVLLTLDGLGDFSIYSLTVSGPDIDPFFASRKLHFRLACDERFDCRSPPSSSPASPELAVVIDYLAKDYSSFRQALLDFVPTRLAEWTERSEADIGMMLLELLAYTADNLSYLQDRVANEAFLGTATQRRSVAGHLQLIGYQMDEGASARTWLQFQVSSAHTLTRDLRVTNQPRTTAEPLLVFEPLVEARLDPSHNAMALYSWGNDKCCLPSTALSIALIGSYPKLESGDYLLIEDATHRDVVRLTSTPQILPAPLLSSPPASPPGSPPSTAITIVNWSAATPLQHDYCAPEVTVRGNMVVATHGMTINEALAVPPDEFPVPLLGPRRLRLQLANAPLAHLDPETLALTAPVTPAGGPSTLDPFAQPRPGGISSLVLTVDGVIWQQQPSLLDSGPDAKVFRVEISDLGEATIVFGQGGTDTTDQQFGLRPRAGAKIEATYRVGGGTAGNVGADTLIRLDPTQNADQSWLSAVTNPLPATKGRDLESRDHARRLAPGGFKDSLVAVTAADYQQAAQAYTAADGSRPIQRGNAAFKWTGSWLTVALGVEVAGTETLDSQLAADLSGYLDGKRLAGYDIQVNGATYVPIDLIVGFCVAPGFRSADVQQGIEQALGNQELPGTAAGLFRPGNFSFGDSLYASQIYAAAMAVAGVESLRILRLTRLHAERPDDETRANLSQGYLGVGRDEIIRLDNERNFPENGVMVVQPLE